MKAIRQIQRQPRNKVKRQKDYAPAILTKMKQIGIPLTQTTDDIPDSKTIGIFDYPYNNTIILLVRHAPGILAVWCHFPARDVIAGVGVVCEHNDAPGGRSVFCPDPLQNPVPPMAQLTLGPLWQQLGLTYRQATRAEVFDDPKKLMVNICPLRDRMLLGYLGVSLLAVHRAIPLYMWEADCEEALNAYYKTATSYDYAFSFCPPPP